MKDPEAPINIKQEKARDKKTVSNKLSTKQAEQCKIAQDNERNKDTKHKTQMNETIESEKMTSVDLQI